MLLTQSSNAVLMVRPASFGFNPETAGSNTFQRTGGSSPVQVQGRAIEEFDGMVELLRANNVKVLVLEDTTKPITPDAVFPNNWISTHPDGRVVVYPMEAENRRAEVRLDILDKLQTQWGCKVVSLTDLREVAESGMCLEGTGSVVFDHPNRIAFAAQSPRTDVSLLRQLCEVIGYRPILFEAIANGVPIYHTNVMMSVATDVTVVCLDAIPQSSALASRDQVKKEILAAGRELVEISPAQMELFAGNMLEVQSSDSSKIMVASETAVGALTGVQRASLERHCQLLAVRIPTIEHHGGGSARCMLAEIFLPRSG